MQSEIELECESCHQKFVRRKAEHTRNQKRGRRVFCGRKCQGKVLMIDNMPLNKRCIDTSHLRDIIRIDEHSAFRYHLANAKRHSSKVSKGRECNITLQDLKDTWDRQDGICPYTGWVLINPPSTYSYYSDEFIKAPNRASLDRIDCSKGYVNGNIQFVAYIANIAKNDFDDESLIQFCRAVSEYRK